MADIVKRLRQDEAELLKMVKQASLAGPRTNVRVKDPSLLLADLAEAATEIERLRANLDLRTSNPADYRYWEGRYRDHDESHADPERCKALCQRCHLKWDAKHHARNAALTRRRKAPQIDVEDFINVQN